MDYTESRWGAVWGSLPLRAENQSHRTRRKNRLRRSEFLPCRIPKPFFRKERRTPMFATSQSRNENRAIAIILCPVGILVLSAGVQAQTTSTWSGGAGNWDPCPPTGDALWSTCPKHPNGNYKATITSGPVTVSAQDHDD